jgi:adenine/guanine phosphoribosyltransferase-like PRPP-binding protein
VRPGIAIPVYTEEVLARHLAEKFAGEKIDYVVGPAMGGSSFPMK